MGLWSSASQTHWPPAWNAPRFSSPGKWGPLAEVLSGLAKPRHLKSPGHPFQAREAPSRREARALGLFSAAGDLGLASSLFGSARSPYRWLWRPPQPPGSRASTCPARSQVRSRVRAPPAPPSYRSQGAGRWAGTRSQPRGVRRGTALPAAAPLRSGEAGEGAAETTPGQRAETRAPAPGRPAGRG